MKRITLGGFAISALLIAAPLSTTYAADMAVKAPPLVPLFDWTGWYGGVNGGYGWGSSRATTTTDTSLLGTQYPQGITHKGWEASVEGGYCYQYHVPVATCIEVSWEFPRLNSGQTPLSIPLSTTIYNQTHVDPILVGPHLGYLTDSNHMMWYVAGGAAFGEVGGSSAAIGAATSTATPGDKWVTGWYAGAGIERMIDQHWSWKVEYDYVRFSGSGTCAPYIGTNAATFTGLGAPMSCLGADAYDNVMTVGINYHLGSH